MKLKGLLLLIVLICGKSAVAQNVGIGTTTPNAVLDIKAGNPTAPTNNDGLLIPRVDTFPVANPTALQNGMMLYLSAVAGINQPGVYCWNNNSTRWDKLQTNAGWSLLGNAGTNPATHFIGTTDDNDLIFKRNNIVSGRISNSNLAFGAYALNNNAGGFCNAALGTGALTNNTAGFHNTA